MERSGFRKKYGELGIIRAFLPKATPVVAMSATLPLRVRRDVLKKLEFASDGYVFINIGNDRPNVSIVVRAIHNTMKSYSDLDFLIPSNVQVGEDIPSTMVYMDNIQECPEIADHLDDTLPEHLRGQGLVRPFSAAYSQEYREAVLKLFKLGIVRVLVCTDAAGMVIHLPAVVVRDANIDLAQGCNLPKVEVVVQWKMPDSISTFVQRAGRAARSPHLRGLAVLLVEKSAYNVNLDEIPPSRENPASSTQTPQPNGAQTTHTATDKRKKKEVQQYASACGVNRGKYAPTAA
ncbi:hypothetical protein CC1G_10021 [Coprinopsis cinerea okayama7|uniref:DNA 3'-5' helicase n=1 Tax=Coprinopsis cinerea (strain Okayama-7 / 130 / ATCC MYA-4618 / FGSC 9003) TaxID=240176 RepID=A8NDM2_COPC7|nr:hypothetical protein CC1G_10021 [Coprinopsis cinerea okayama7\|eukprot:XP_001832807.2 hypothetical protein CC1G_10021 [Coprinopsis cinerea okayama7\